VNFSCLSGNEEMFKVSTVKKESVEELKLERYIYRERARKKNNDTKLNNMFTVAQFKKNCVVQNLTTRWRWRFFSIFFFFSCRCRKRRAIAN
jgi:hypothetical protein